MDNNINIRNQSENWFGNPLLYFENLIYYRGFSLMRSNFVDIEQDIAYGYDIYYDEKDDVKIFYDRDIETGEYYEVRTTFTKYLDNFLLTEFTNSLKKINEIFFNLRVKEYKKEFIESVLDDISFILKSLSSYEEAKKYDIIENRINLMENHVKFRYSRILEIDILNLKINTVPPHQELNKEKLRALISSGNEGLFKCLKILNDYLINQSEKELLNRCILWQGRYNDWKKIIQKGGKKENAEINEITNQTLQLIDEI